MGSSDKMIAVAKIQKYINNHLDEEIMLEDLSRASGYSKYHASRVFKELTCKTLFETIRALRLTKAAQTLRDSNGKVIDIALNNGFASHDGFTRAFARQFGITPQKYQRETPAVSYFIHNPIEAYYMLKEGPGIMPKEPIIRSMTVTAVERPARKLILKRAKKAKATDGHVVVSEELGCDWMGQMNSIPERLHNAAGMTLPPNLIIPGYTDVAVGTEVPIAYDKPIPDGFEVMALPPCTMLYFQGALFEEQNDFSHAIGILWELMDAYDPKLYGWEYAPDLAPYYNFGAEAETGALMARPVRLIHA